MNIIWHILYLTILELCLSDDHQFCGLQLFRFGDFQYKPVFEPRFYEGKDVESITQLV